MYLVTTESSRVMMFAHVTEAGSPEIVEIIDDNDEEDVNWDDDSKMIPRDWKVGERKRDKKTVFQSSTGSVLVGLASALSVMNSQNYGEADIQRMATYVLNNKRGKKSQEIISLVDDDERHSNNTVQDERKISPLRINKRKSGDFPTINKKVKKEVLNLEDETSLEEQGEIVEPTHEVERNIQFHSEYESDTLADPCSPTSETESVAQSYETRKDWCDECQKEFSSKFSLKVHRKAIHEGIKFPCDYCEKEYPRVTSLQVHIRTVHYGETLTCDICSKIFARKGSLQRHIQSTHEGIRYPCNQCDYQASDKSNLKKHIKSQHKTNNE